MNDESQKPTCGSFDAPLMASLKFQKAEKELNQRLEVIEKDRRRFLHLFNCDRQQTLSDLTYRVKRKSASLAEISRIRGPKESIEICKQQGLQVIRAKSLFIVNSATGEVTHKPLTRQITQEFPTGQLTQQNSGNAKRLNLYTPEQPTSVSRKAQWRMHRSVRSRPGVGFPPSNVQLAEPLKSQLPAAVQNRNTLPTSIYTNNVSKKTMYGTNITDMALYGRNSFSKIGGKLTVRKSKLEKDQESCLLPLTRILNLI